MAEVHQGADEEGQHLLAFFYSNPLVDEYTDESGSVVKKEVEPIDHEKMCKIIKDCLGQPRCQTRLRFEHATYWNMRRRLSAGCQILHFTGHGYDQSLAFEAEEAQRCGMVESLDADTLTKLFQHGSKPDLVFLESGGSHTIGRGIAEVGVPHVIAVESQTELPDGIRQIFTKAFYHALFVNKMTVKEAFEHAVTAVTAINEKACPTGVSFHLFPKDGNHEMRLFHDLREGEFVNETPQLLASNLPDAKDIYFGKIELQKAVGLLLDHKVGCLSFVGERGMGMLERALQAWNYVCERGGFGFDAIFYADCLPSSKDESCLYTEGVENRSNIFHRIGLAIGMPRESVPSAQELSDFLVKSTQDKMSAQRAAENTPPKIFLLLKDVDAFYEGGGVEARKSLITSLDTLCRINGKIKLLLTCEKQLLENANACFTSTKEQVHKVLPLSNENSVNLIMHLLAAELEPRDADVNSQSSFNHEEAEKRLKKLLLTEDVNGHPGTLRQLAPDLPDLFQNEGSDEEIANKYLGHRAEFKKVRSKPFSSERANKIASEAGLQDRRLKSVWVAATEMAKGGRGVSGDDDNAYYHSVPWKYLLQALQNSLGNLQTAGGCDSMCSSNSSQSMGMRGGGQSSSSERSSSSETRRVGGSDGLGHGYVSSFTPRLLGSDDLSFVLGRLRSCTPEADHPENDNEDEVISLEAFVKFCRWWGPVTITLSRISNVWASMDPVKVQGFMGSKKAKERLLEEGLAGRFLLGFSESNPGRLVLTYTCEASQDMSRGQARTNGSEGCPVVVKHKYVTVRPDGRWTLHYGKGIEGISYSSMHDLVNNKVDLLTLYPSSAKENAFGTS